MTDEELAKYLSKVRRIFDVDRLIHQHIDNQQVIDYYIKSDYGYKVFHSAEGAIHMALNFDGRFDKEGYHGQAKIVQEHINQLNAKQALELGSGKGFNSVYLAEQNDDTQFIGMDLTPAHVAIAEEKARGLANLNFEIGDFQDLCFASQTFDLLFEVESICHASDMARAMSESYRVLRPGGRFILFDGFRRPGFEQLDDDIQLAARLVEVTMAVGHPWIIDDWLELAQNIGFKALEVEDISEAIMPNLIRFQLLARAYFKYPILSRTILRALPPGLVKNSVAGLLMPFTVKAGAQGYYKIILTRE